MYDLRRFFPAQYLACRALVCWLGLAAFSLTASADVVLDPAFDRFKAVVTGNTAALSFGSDGTALAVPKSSGMGYVATGLSPTAGEVSRYGALSTKYGQVPFKVAQTFSVGKLAFGVASLATAVTGGFAGVAISVAAPYVFDWLTDAGLSVDASGVVGVLSLSGPCTVSNGGWGYREFASGSCFSASEAMTASLKADGKINDGFVTKCVPSATPSTVPPSCGSGWNDGTSSIGVGYSASYTGPQVETVTPKTASQIESALASQPRTASEIEKILSETIKYPEIQPDPVDWVRIDPINPGDYIKSPTKTDQKTTTNPDGSKIEETKSCWVKGTVQTGASLKLTEVCNTDTVSKSPSGTVTGTTTASTESETADAAEPIKDDSGFCETLIGKLVCADLDTPSAEPIDKTTKTLSYAAENHFGGGACPADQVMTTHNGQSLKVWDWATSCDKINQFFRPLFLTLCAFTALMILAPAVKEA